MTVRVPGRVGVGGPGDAGDAHAGLDQPSCQEHALAVDVPAVAIAGARVFAVDADRASDRGRRQEVEGLGLESIEVPEPLVASETLRGAARVVPQGSAVP